MVLIPHICTVLIQIINAVKLVKIITIKNIKNMEKVIFLPHEVKKEIAKDFKTSSVSVWNALTFKTKSGFANTLRAAALERGGVVYDGTKK